MRKFYSRLSRVEEKKNIKKAVIYAFLSVSLLMILLTVGIPILAKMAGFLADLKSSGTPVEREDNTPPAPPSFENIPEATNKYSVDIKGTAEAGSTVKIIANGKEDSVISSVNGDFSYQFSLNDGKNTVYAIAVDTSGNESQESQTSIIIYDADPPLLEITKPEDGASFYGSIQRQVTIEGSCDTDAKLTANGRYVSVEEDGVFFYTTSLNEGENGFIFVAEDVAGNKSEKGITLHFWK